MERKTSAQLRPYLVRQRNAIVCDRDTTVGRRFLTEAAALDFAKNPANWEYNNTRVLVVRDARDGSEVEELLNLSWK